MSDRLDDVKQYGQEWFERQFVCGYLLLDEKGIVLASDGEFDKLGLSEVEVGRPINEQYLFTEGLLPLKPPSLYLPMVKVGQERSLDIHLFHTEEGYGMFLLDVTEQDQVVAGLQQRLNALALIKETNETERKPGQGRRRFDQELFSALDIAVLRRDRDGHLELMSSEKPRWMAYFPLLLGLGSSEAEDDTSYSFIGHFLEEAHDFWNQKKRGRIGSGTWVETDDNGKEHLFEAVAMKTGHEEILVVAHNLSLSGEKQNLIQIGRDLAMNQDMLQRMKTELLEARDHLEETVYKRTHQLQEANARLAHELELRRELENERHTILSQLQQAQKMEAIGTLAGGIAHDFNNILSAILGFTELSLPEAVGNKRLHHNLEQVLFAARRAGELTRQILVFSRQSEPERQPIHMATVVGETLKLMRASVPAGIRIEQDVCSNAYIMADPTQMHQVVMNLCTNAMQAIAPENGTLSVGLHERQLKAHETSTLSKVKPGYYIELSVRDTGGGMPPEVARRIFEPFYTTKEKGKGTGMGLSVVHGIVSACGGALDVQSQPGVGTIFSVLLPALSDKPALQSLQTQEAETGTECILFVDDEVMQVDLARQMLGRLGYRVTATTDCVEALRLFADDPQQFDLIISDINMPQMNGSLLSAKMKHIRPDIRIILCSGYSEIKDDEAPEAMNVEGYLMKPVGISEMAGKIRRVLDQ